MDLEQCLEEHPPEYDPQANGSAEVGVKLLKGHLRTMRSCLEMQIGFRDSGATSVDCVDGSARC